MKFERRLILVIVNLFEEFEQIENNNTQFVYHLILLAKIFTLISIYL